MLKVIHDICEAIDHEDGTPYFVGGCVRDEILGHLPPDDWDIEVFGMEPTKLKALLNYFGPIGEVGDSFGVILLKPKDREWTGSPIQFSIPRRENKEGRGHKGFICEMDPKMTIREAAGRRDFTINSIYQNAITGEVFDYYGGRTDLADGRLKHVGPHFGEDPLRVLRGMQFVSRFDLIALDEGTRQECICLLSEYDSLPVERVGGEWRKWATKSVKPSRGLHFLNETHWLVHYPALEAMMGVQQDPHWHPEGDVWTHVGYVCDAMADICKLEDIKGEDREVLMYAALTHDLGKPNTTAYSGQPARWRSPGHAEAGVPIAREFLKSIGVFDRVIQRVLPLVSNHMFPAWEEQTRRTVRRLKVRLGDASLEELLMVMEADQSGRPPNPPGEHEFVPQIRELAKELPPKIEPLLTGRHIISAGITQGPEIGKIKATAFEAQLCEEFADEAGALEWLEKYLQRQR